MSHFDATYSVVAVNIRTGERRVMATGKTKADAEAFVSMAVMRRGVEDEIFKTELETVDG